MSNQEQQPMTAPKGLIEFAHQKRVTFVSKLDKAMKAIEADVDENAGLYPFNGGRISQSEVCRRAGVSKVTLQGKGHKGTTKVWVDKWVERVQAQVVSGKRSVRKTITGRVESLKAAHAKIANKWHVAQLSFDSAQNRIRELETENAALREQLSVTGERKVVALPKIER